MPPKKCLRCGQPHATLQNKCKGAPTWEGFPDGPAYQALGDKKECKDAIRSAEGGKPYNGQIFTKQMLEAFFCKAFDMPAPGASDQSTTMQSTTTQPDTTQPDTTQQGTPSVPSVPQSAADKITPSMQKLSLGVTPAWKFQFLSDKKLESNVGYNSTDLAVLSKYEGNKLEDKIKGSSQRGTTGIPTKIITNYVAVNQVPNQLYVYDVNYISIDDPVNPIEVKRRTEKRQVFESLKVLPPLSENNPPPRARKDWATNFNTVWSLKPLQFPNSSTAPPVQGQIYMIPAVQYQKPSGRSATLDHVQFTFTDMLDFTHQSSTNSLLNSGLAPNAKGASVHIAALNGLVSQHVTATQAGIIQVGANKFFLTNGFKEMAHPTSGKPAPFNAHRGYYSSIRPGSEQVLLNINTKAGTFINPMKVSDWLTNVNHIDYADYGPKQALLIGRSVRICYDRTPLSDDFDPNHEDNRHKVIASFGKKPTLQKFWHDEAGRQVEISVRDYFVKELRSPVPNNDFDCVNVGIAPRVVFNQTTQRNEDDPNTVGKQIWIPADFVELDPYQPFSRQLSPHDKAAMLHAAQHWPAQMQSLISTEGFDKLGLMQANAPDLALLGLNITPKLLEIPGRMLPPPVIMFAASKDVVVYAASWMLRDRGSNDVKFVRTNAAPLAQGVRVLDFCEGGLAGLAVSQNGQPVLGDNMSKRMAEHGIMFQARATTYTRVPPNIQSQPDSLMANAIRSQGAAQVKMPLFLILLDDTNSDKYAKIKRVFDQHLGMHTVCLTAPKAVKGGKLVPDAQLLSNLALKFNLKLGGQNHRIMTGSSARDHKLAFNSIPADTIVLGADVSHAPSQMSDCPSVAAVVGSIDKEFSTFPGSMRLQASGQEVIQELKEMVAERVVAFAEARKDKQLPRHMIFYRDGVGEDQFDMASSVEIPEVKAGFALARTQLNSRNFGVHNGELDLIFIVVGKRHHTRFFCTNETQTKKDKNSERQGLSGNVLPGLIVDSVITRPPVDSRFDFFLQSHQALKGTAKSGHYIVLEKGSLSTDVIQTMTHHFCYNYARVTKGVSYAGPAYYADRLADRGTHYLKAYTAGRSEPGWLKTPAEVAAGKAGIRPYQARVAGLVAQTVEWNPNPTGVANRKNPWHPNLDNVMFWL
ncbi:hypothetical protein LTS10_004904 [Elasticomyces elasticus]|nr:hypothetical protein LTS10_004904 [Elasticomyces elasticus]